MEKSKPITYTQHVVISIAISLAPVIYIALMWIIQNQGSLEKRHFDNKMFMIAVPTALSLVSIIAGFVFKRLSLKKAENDPSPQNIRSLPSRMIIVGGLLHNTSVYALLLFLLSIIDFQTATAVCVVVSFLTLSCKISREEWGRLGIDDIMKP